MKITNQLLKEMIKEELRQVLKENQKGQPKQSPQRMQFFKDFAGLRTSIETALEKNSPREVANHLITSIDTLAYLVFDELSKK